MAPITAPAAAAPPTFLTSSLVLPSVASVTVPLISWDVPLTTIRSKVSVMLPLRSPRVAFSTEATTPRSTVPAGTTTRPSRVRSSTVVASNRSSTWLVPDPSGVCRRTSTSVPTGIVTALAAARASGEFAPARVRRSSIRSLRFT